MVASKASDADRIAKLNAYLAARTDPDSDVSWKLVLRGDGENIRAKFEPQINVTIHIPYFDVRALLPGSGEGKSTLKGVGEFRCRQPAAFLSGTYKLRVKGTEARLYDGDEQIWFGKGKQEGLEGDISMEFQGGDLIM